MSDWLEHELARGLSPVAAPDQLKIHLGLAPATPWEFPRAACAVAMAIVLIVGGGYVASRTPAFDLRPVSQPTARVQLASDGVPRCERPDASGFSADPGTFKATILLAHAAPASEAAHTQASEAGCHLCHNL
jgi:hypothetical protein